MVRSWILIPLLSLTVPAVAQTKSRPASFEILRLGGAVVTEVADTPFHDQWSPEMGFRLEVETPVNVGEFRVGVHAFDNSSLANGVPGFRSVFVYLGWAWTINLWDRLGASAGLTLGNFLMDFGERPFADISELESELGVGLEARVRFPARSRWAMVVGGEYRSIYTEQRIEYGFVSAGFTRTVSTPRWLRDFLR